MDMWLSKLSIMLSWANIEKLQRAREQNLNLLLALRRRSQKDSQMLVYITGKISQGKESSVLRIRPTLW